MTELWPARDQYSRETLVVWCSLSYQTKGHWQGHCTAWPWLRPFQGGCPCNNKINNKPSSITQTACLLIDFKEVIFFEEILCQRLSIANTLKGRVHEACVPKVTETSGTRCDTPLMGRWGRRGVVFGLKLMHHCNYLFRPWVVTVTSYKHTNINKLLPW